MSDDELRIELDSIAELPLVERAAAFAKLHSRIADALEGNDGTDRHASFEG